MSAAAVLRELAEGVGLTVLICMSSIGMNEHLREIANGALASWTAGLFVDLTRLLWVCGRVRKAAGIELGGRVQPCFALNGGLADTMTNRAFRRSSEMSAVPLGSCISRSARIQWHSGHHYIATAMLLGVALSLQGHIQ